MGDNLSNAAGRTLTPSPRGVGPSEILTPNLSFETPWVDGVT